MNLLADAVSGALIHSLWQNAVVAVALGMALVVLLPVAPRSSEIPRVNWMSWLQAWALPVWLIGVLLSSLRIVSASAHTVVLKRNSEPADATVASTVAALAARLGIERPVGVLVSRMIRTAFSHQGRYDLDDLPAADYRVVAVTALPRGAWTDPAVLDRLWPSAVAVRLQEGQEHTTPLKVIPAPIDLVQ